MMQQPRSAAQVLDDLLAITPEGWALPNYAPSNWASALTPIADEWSLVETTAAAMVAEIDPRTAAHMLPDYERVLGPDPYGRDAASLALTTAEAAALAWQRWTASGNMAPADYIALAAQAGFVVTIAQYWPTIAGLMHAGDLVCCDMLVGVGAFAAGDAIGWRQIVFYWLVQAPVAAEAALLAAVIAGEAPSHTVPVFSYS